jgi:hypothetical protein
MKPLWQIRTIRGNYQVTPFRETFLHKPTRPILVGNLLPWSMSIQKLPTKMGHLNIAIWCFGLIQAPAAITPFPSADTLVNNVDSKYVQIKCTVSNVAGVGAVYESSHTSTALSIALDGTQFVVTSKNAVTLTKTFDDGLPDAPATISFECTKVR